MLALAASGRPAYVVCSAVAMAPERAVATARRWFGGLGVDVQELRARTRREASSPASVEAAHSAGLVYIAGGDPGRTVRILAGSSVWAAVVGAWRSGAALAGSSAGAMALCRWTLVRGSWPGHDTRRPVDALGLVPDSAVLPHFDTFGERWIPSAQAALGDGVTLIGVDERTAAVWHEGAWRVVGPGAVHVVAQGARSPARRGEPLDIPQPSTQA